MDVFLISESWNIWHQTLWCNGFGPSLNVIWKMLFSRSMSLMYIILPFMKTEPTHITEDCKALFNSLGDLLSNTIGNRHNGIVAEGEIWCSKFTCLLFCYKWWFPKGPYRHSWGYICFDLYCAVWHCCF